MVEQNRHGIRSFYNEQKGLEIIVGATDEVENVDFLVSIHQTDLDDTEILPSNCNLKKLNLKFEITIQHDEWSLISPKSKVYKSGRSTNVLQEGWVDVMRRCIWHSQKLPCAYSFDRHFVGSDSAYIKIEGHCTEAECQARIILICQEVVGNDVDVKFSVITTDTSHIVHTKKIRLQKLAKSIIGEKLLKEKPKEWRRNEAGKRMKDGDPEPADLFSLKQLQNARQDAKNAELGIVRGLPLFDSISAIKNNAEFNHYFRYIGYDYFCLTYWSPSQISISNDIANELGNAVALDATSSIVLKINRPDGDSSDIFLSIMCTHIGDQIVPIAQALSEKNDTIFYVNWLQTWLQSGGKAPRELNMDMGKAIQNGSCLAFNNITFKTYKDACLLILFEEPMFLKLFTQIRTDIAHLMHAVAGWPCYPKDNHQVKKLFVKCVGYMSTIFHLDQFERVLKYILIIAYSPFYDSTRQQAMKYITKLVATYEFDLNTSTTIKPTEIKNSYEEERSKNSKKSNEKWTLTYTYIQTIKNQSLSKVKKEGDLDLSLGIQKNDYFLPDFANRLIDLAKDFVCWTNVMQNFFKNPHDVAISARAVACIGDIKASMENTVMRVDKFLVKHCRQIHSDGLLARAAINRIIKDKKQIKSNENIEEYETEHLLVVEKWRNKCNKLLIDDDDIFNETAAPNLLEAQLPSTDQTINLSVVNNNDSLNVHELNNSLHDHKYAKFENDVVQQSSLIEDEQLEIATVPVANVSAPVSIPSVVYPAQPNLNPKIRGIHVRPCPDIALRLHQKYHTCSNSARKRNLVNGSKQSAKRMKNDRITLSNTCAFDTITEILISTCVKVIDFKDFVQKSIDDRKVNQYLCYANTVYDYSTTRVASIFYTNRAHILYSIFYKNTSHIDCNTNITQLFQTLMNNYDCTLEKTRCNNCGFNEDLKKMITFLPDLRIAWVDNYQSLEQELNVFFQDKILNCKKCKTLNLSVTYIIGPYLWIDTDEAYRASTYAKDELQIESENFATDIRNVPQTITVRNDTFVLCGIVKFIPPLIENGVGHYIAYCLTNTNWTERNDLVTYKNILPVNTPPIKMSSLFYAKSIHLTPP